MFNFFFIISFTSSRKSFVTLFICHFVDDIVYKVQMSNVGCYISSICACIYLCVDDILLLAPIVAGLHYMLNVCEEELLQLDMCINVKKSVSIRFGPRFNADCVQLNSKFDGTLK